MLIVFIVFLVLLIIGAPVSLSVGISGVCFFSSTRRNAI